MKISLNAASPNPYTLSQMADRVLCGSAISLPKPPYVPKGAIGPNGWPVGADSYSQNVFLGDTPTDYVFIVLKGGVSSVDLNQGINNGGHVKIVPVKDTGLGVASAPFRAMGADYFIANTTDPGETRWAIVAVADLERWKADPYAWSGAYVERVKLFAVLRAMDFMQTNQNQTAFYPDGDMSRAAPLAGPMPLSQMVKLSLETKVGLWLPFPVRASDDTARKIITACEPLRQARIPVYLENGNEIWNSGNELFKKNHDYAVAQDQALWWKAATDKYTAALTAYTATKTGTAPTKPPPADGNRWYGYRATQLSKLAQSMGWVSRRDFHMVIGCFTNAPEQSVAVWEGVALAGGTDADFSKWSISSYIHGDVGANFDKTIAMIKAGDAGVEAAIEEILHGASSTPDWAARVILPKHKAIANAHGLGLVVYEGQMSFYTIPTFADSALVGTGLVKQQIVDFFAKIMRHPRAKEIFTVMFQVCADAGVELFCIFNDQTKWGEQGLWGMVGTPGWDAVLAWIAAHPDVAAVQKDDLPTIIGEMEALVARMKVVAG